MKNLSTRVRIALLVIALVLPILAWSVAGGLLQRKAAERSERQELQLLAELIAKRPEQILENAHQLLFAIGVQVDPLLADREYCHRYFRRLLPESGGTYRSVGLILPDGNIFCSSVISSAADSINVADRPHFRMAVGSGRFSVGEYQVGRVTGSAGINFAHPVFDADRKLVAVLFAGLDISTFVEGGESRRENLRGELERVVTIVDRNNTVLAQYPAFGAVVGQKHGNPRVVEALASPGNLMFSTTDSKGVPRLYVVETAGRNPDGSAPLRVIVSTPSHLIFAEADAALKRTILGILAITLLLLAGAWFGSEIFVLRRFRVLLDMAERVRGGDYSVRSGLGGGREELSRLGSALDAMVQDLQARDTQLKEALRQLNEQAVTDQLTGLPNRRYLWEVLGAELARARRKRVPLSVLLFDIDHFKRINDRWGHEAGDLVLRNVAHAVRKVVRESDIVARHGGEEFVIVLPEADERVALARAEALRAEISAMRLTYGGDALGTVTISVGVVCSREGAESAEDLVRAADHAMYQAKEGGRDRVVQQQPAAA